MFESWRAMSRAEWKRKRPALLWSFALILVAASYYGLYFRCGFNLSDEGSVVLLSQRILNGERPFDSMFLGYNVLWFYPIVGLFWFAGVNVVAMKVYFFSLAALTALLGCSIVYRITGHRLYAFGIGLILIAIPGTSYRIYLPLLVMVNSYCLIRMIWDNSWRWVALGAAVLGLTFLVRVDVGIFFSALWIGTLVLKAFAPLLPERKQPGLLFSLALVVFLAGAVHLPVYLLARSQGFSAKFLRQYSETYRLMRDGVAGSYFKPVKKAAPSIPVAPPVDAANNAELSKTAAMKKSNQAPAAEAGGTTLARKPFSQIWTAKKWKARIQAILTYAPIFSLGALIAWSLSLCLYRWNESEAYSRCLSVLVLAGGALTIFPQFFGFRPDVSHLAEFMSGFVIAAAAGGFYVFQEIRRLKVFGQAAAIALCILLILHTAVWIVFAFPQRGAGTIVLKSGRTEPFHAENGVNILLSSEEFAGYSAIRDLVLNNSLPGQYVVCYPYSPGINVLANRPTYEWSLYVDNSARDFDAKTIAKLKAKKPAVIVINDWAINQNESSRFSVWAVKTQQYVEENYVLAGTVLRYQIYALRMGE